MHPNNFIPLCVYYWLAIGFMSKNGILALQASVKNHGVVYTNLGQDAEIFAFIPEEALNQHSEKLCRWSRTSLDSSEEDRGRTIMVNATEKSVRVQMGSGTFEYSGKGVDKGDCGLVIRNVSEAHLERWGLIFIDIEIWIANVTLLKYEKPLKPVISAEDFGQGEINITDDGKNDLNPVQIKCCSNGGKPVEETKLKWNYENGTLPRILDSDSISTCITLNKTFTSEDNGKAIKCLLNHPAFNNSVSADGHPETTETVAVINVNYAPKLVRNGNTNELEITQRNRAGKMTDLLIQVQGNPIPSLNVIDNGTNEILTILSTNIDDSKRNLLVFNVTIDATKSQSRTLKIFIMNALGEDAGVTIVSPSPGDEESSYWTVLMIGIVMSVIFIGIIIYIFYYTAKKRGWLCYKRRTDIYNLKKKATSPPRDDYASVSRTDDAAF